MYSFASLCLGRQKITMGYQPLLLAMPGYQPSLVGSGAVVGRHTTMLHPGHPDQFTALPYSDYSAFVKGFHVKGNIDKIG